MMLKESIVFLRLGISELRSKIILKIGSVSF